MSTKTLSLDCSVRMHHDLRHWDLGVRSVFPCLPAFMPATRCYLLSCFDLRKDSYVDMLHVVLYQEIKSLTYVVIRNPCKK